MEDGDAMLFRYNGCKKPRLKGLGITTHIPMLRCQMKVDEALKKEIAAHIVKSQGRKSQKQVKDILDKRVTIKPQKFVVANKTKWSSSISDNLEALKTRKANEEERQKLVVGSARRKRKPERSFKTKKGRSLKLLPQSLKDWTSCTSSAARASKRSLAAEKPFRPPHSTRARGAEGVVRAGWQSHIYANVGCFGINVVCTAA